MGTPNRMTEVTTMNRRVLAGLVLATVGGLGLGLLGSPAGAEDEGRLTWLTDVDAARAEARATGRPLFLVFRCVP